jgi:pyruvate,water dikinase
MIKTAALPAPLIALNMPNVVFESVGGKGANLIKLINAGLPVPNGFLIPTSAYHEYLALNNLIPWIEARLQALDSTSPADLDAASKAIRDRFIAKTVSSDLSQALEAGWQWLGAGPVAVRSSATAEDLPDLSFAGQQDTFLNVADSQTLRKAVVDCWSSLWSARAIGYRTRNHIRHQDVSIAVVVQLMVPSQVSGVLFTANPLNGRRAETVIDATFGLGEALVSGLVEPDHYVVDTQKGTIIRKQWGTKSTRITSNTEGGTTTQEIGPSKEQAIPDQVILQLAQLGQQVESLYTFPQDIEWAYLPTINGPDSKIKGPVYILQSRPITSLYPLPDNLPTEPIKALIGLHVIQGVLEPFTPLGQSAIMEVLLGGGRSFGLNLNLEEQGAFYVAGERVWINVTPIIRHPRGHKAYPTVIQNIDPGIAQAFQEILKDPRLAPKSGSLHLLKPWNMARFLLPNLLQVLRFLRHPEAMAEKTLQIFDQRVAETIAQQSTSGDLATDFNRRVDLLLSARSLFSEFVIPNGITAVVAGMMPFYGILRRFSQQVAADTHDPQFDTLYLEIARGLPNNVTTEMDLALWRTAQAIRNDPESGGVFQAVRPSDLAEQYQTGKLPPGAQIAIAEFMGHYGMRGLGEIDIGRPRWVEKPEHIMGVLQSYLQIDDPTLAPDAVFARGGQTAQTAARKLEDAVRGLPRGRIKAFLVRFAVRRYRALAGLREAPKFFAIRMMGIIRQGLLASGVEMKACKLLEQPDDLFYLHVAELENLAAQLRGWKPGDNSPAIFNEYHELIRERREKRAIELRRRQIPRVLLSDGTAYYEGVRTDKQTEGQIIGDPVSPGVVEGKVRVVINPLEAQLKPGEILVCPGTDPAWTPLFLSAGGLVMEVGGMMTHGSVVAREYGIPAVVGVHKATEKLQTGDRVKIDGSSGQIHILGETSEAEST